MSRGPYTFDEAKQASEKASSNQRAAEQFLIDSTKHYAEAERAYRSALAAEIVKLRAEGMAATACGDVARGNPAVADLKFKRDIAEGVRDAAAQSAWRASADRKDELTFIQWSQRRELAENGAPSSDGADVVTFGGRRAS